MSVVVAPPRSARRPLFAPGVLRRMFLRFSPVLAFYVIVIPAGMFRGAADNIGFPVRSEFTALESVLLTAAPTHWLQGAWFDVYPLRVAATGVYVSWFLIPVTLALPLIMFRPVHYWRFVAMLVVTYYAGMPFFALYPLEPPWLHESGVIRIITDVVPGAAGKDVNPYAAMPSLHVALPAVAGFWYGWRSAWGRLTFAYSALIGLTVVYTGDHYLADVAGGYALAYASWRLARGYLALPEESAEPLRAAPETTGERTRGDAGLRTAA